MLVSIIIPIYNVEKYIEECLESVYQQTYPHIEVILVNDCTPDNSMQIANTIINKYKDKFPSTIVNHEQNKGISEARNSGMKIAKGEYIYFIDSDDVIIHNTIELLAKVAQNNNNIELIEGDYTFYSKNRKNDITPQISSVIYKNYGSKEFFITKEKNLFVWNILYKNDFIKKHSIYFQANMIYEDAFFRMKISQYLTSIAKLNIQTYLYRYNMDSLSHKANTLNLQSIITILRYNSELLSKGTQYPSIFLSFFCKTAFLYWNQPCRILNEHKNYFKPIKEIVNIIYNKYNTMFSLKDLILISPFYIPYNLSKYYVKIIWKTL